MHAVALVVVAAATEAAVEAAVAEAVAATMEVAVISWMTKMVSKKESGVDDALILLCKMRSW